MALILCLETATEVCSVALSKDGKVIQEETLEEGQRHSSELVLLIDTCLKNAQITRDQLDAIAISDGPGSYTGLRVGASTAKAIGYALKIPLIALSSLKCLTAPYSNDDRIILSTIDARRMEAYLGTYKGNKEIAPTYNIIWSQETLKKLVVKHGPLLICGNGIQKVIDVFPLPDDIEVAPNSANASNMCHFAWEKYRDKDFVDTAYHAPFYYKAPNITKPKVLFKPS